MFSSPSSASTRHDHRDLLELLQEGARHAASAYASAFAISFDAMDSLEVIELPPGAETRIDRAQLRALAALYLAADLEPAGIFTAVEDLSGLASSGALRADLGPVAPLLHNFWRDRNNRIAREERLAFFGRLFGASYGARHAEGANDMFETLMLELCESLYQLGEGYPRPPYGSISQQTRIRAAARNLLSNLVSAGGGATPFMAREIINGLKSALEILRQPHLVGVFGARDLWGVVAAIARMAHREQMGQPQSFVQRGKAGMTLIAWLAEVGELLRTYGAPLVKLDDPAISAAIDWLQASLSVSEWQSRHVSPSSPPANAGGVSDWADLGI